MSTLSADVHVSAIHNAGVDAFVGHCADLGVTWLSGQDPDRVTLDRHGLDGLVLSGEVGALPGNPNLFVEATGPREWRRDGAPYLVQFIVNGGGHVIPQSTARFPRIVGRVTKDLDAPREAVQFYLGVP